jgi:hypothetical protein
MTTVTVFIYGKKRRVIVADKACPTFACFRPHDCPTQGAKGVRQSTERYMCLTNVLRGCPEHPQPKRTEKAVAENNP